MFKKSVLVVAVMSAVLVPAVAWSKVTVSKMAVEPTGAVRAAQYLKVLKWCQVKYGTGLRNVSAEWGSHYGETHWWCKHV